MTNKPLCFLSAIAVIASIGCQSKDEFVKNVQVELSKNDNNSFKKVQAISMERLKWHSSEYEANYYLALSRFLLDDANAFNDFKTANKYVAESSKLAPTLEIEKFVFLPAGDFDAKMKEILLEFDEATYIKFYPYAQLRAMIYPSDANGWYYMGKFIELKLPQRRDSELNRCGGFIDYFDEKFMNKDNNLESPRNLALKSMKSFYLQAYYNNPNDLKIKIAVIPFSLDICIKEHRPPTVRNLDEMKNKCKAELQKNPEDAFTQILLMELVGKEYPWGQTEFLNLNKQLLAMPLIKNSPSRYKYFNDILSNYQILVQEHDGNLLRKIAQDRANYIDSEDQLILAGIARDAGMSSVELVSICQTHTNFAGVVKIIVDGRRMKINASKSTGVLIPFNDKDLVRSLNNYKNMP